MFFFPPFGLLKSLDRQEKVRQSTFRMQYMNRCAWLLEHPPGEQVKHVSTGVKSLPIFF